MADGVCGNEQGLKPLVESHVRLLDYSTLIAEFLALRIVQFTLFTLNLCSHFFGFTNLIFNMTKAKSRDCTQFSTTHFTNYFH